VETFTNEILKGKKISKNFENFSRGAFQKEKKE
jgi:hypothetical protein